MASTPKSSHTIWIRNQSKSKASYALIASIPSITPAPDAADIATKVVAAFRNVPSTGLVRFEIPKQMFAVCGTSLCDGGDEASVLEIFDQRPIVLGREEDDGSIGPGSTLCVSVEDSQPAFVDAEGEGLNAAGAFCIHVMTGFTHAEAKAGGYFVGLCGPWNSPQVRRNVGFYVAFTPKPGTSYKIQPRAAWTLAVGDLKVRTNPAATSLGSLCEIDFESLGAEDVEVRHTNRNELVISSAQAQLPLR